MLLRLTRLLAIQKLSQQILNKPVYNILSIKSTTNTAHNTHNNKNKITNTNIYLISTTPNNNNNNSNKFGRQLTTKITKINTKAQLQKLITKYKGSFNIMNITALLKRARQIDNLNTEDTAIYSKIFEQVSKQWDNNKCSIPNDYNSRAIANIIGYTSSLQYHGMDDRFIQLDYERLFRYMKPRQFVMVYRGLLKLNIYQKCIIDNNSSNNNINQIDKQNQQNNNIQKQYKYNITQKLILKYVTNYFNIGQLISLWRNLIKYKKITMKLNQYLIQLITLKKVNNNLKDYGYFMYCYISQYQYIVNNHNMNNNSGNSNSNNKDNNLNKYRSKIQKMLEEYPENILYSSRVNIFQICILLDHLTKLKQLKIKIIPQKTLANNNNNNNFNYLLQQHYLRNIKAKPQLRSLANGYYSMLNYFGKANREVYNLTGRKFIDVLEEIKGNTQDYQSISSLFIQIQGKQSYQLSQQQQQLLLQQQLQQQYQQNENSIQRIQYQRLFTMEQLISVVTQTMFQLQVSQSSSSNKNNNNNNNKHIFRVPNKQFQKLLYGYYLYNKKQTNNTNNNTNTNIFKLQKKHKDLIIASILSRQQLTQIQIGSLISICGSLQIKNQELCRYFQSKVINKKNSKNSKDSKDSKDSKKKKCVLGLDSLCINCIV